MKPQALFISALGCAMLLSAIPAHSQTTDLEKMLTSSIKERVQMPLLFSTRDTTFALSLPDDEPAEVYLHVTVDRKGRVKEKLTRVNANHFGYYVAPAFAEATKELRIPNEAMPALSGKDTSLMLVFPLEYQCVFDTISIPKTGAGDWVMQHIYDNPYRDSPYRFYDMFGQPFRSLQELDKDARHVVNISLNNLESRFAKPTPIWYYLAFFKEE